ncbi:MAG TPA: ribosome silencing factor [Actinomycetota bacterium]|nr:ribosome silencing factor [Actinomycetota bacterium]
MTPLELVRVAAEAASDKKAQAIVALDVRELLAITDYFLICSGTSERQVRTISDEITKQLRESGARIIRREGEREAQWILLDYEDFVIHVFGAEQREYYDLERLWKDAPRVAVLSGEKATG